VYETVNTSANNANTGWDGMYNKQLLPSDVYVYLIEVLCDNNVIIPLKGNVTLIR